MADRSKSGMGGSKPKAKSSSKSSKPHSIHVKRAHGGGFIATHHMKSKPGEMAEDPQDHVVGDMAQLQQHMQDAMGDQPPADGAAPAPQGQPMPQQGAPAPQAGM